MNDLATAPPDCIYGGHHTREEHKRGCWRFRVLSDEGRALVVDLAGIRPEVRCTHAHRTPEAVFACGRRIAREEAAHR